MTITGPKRVATNQPSPLGTPDKLFPDELAAEGTAMPALRIFGAEEPARGPGEGMLFDRLPIPARKDPRLSPGAKLLLAAIVPKGGPWPDWVEIDDNRLIEETDLCRSMVQEYLKQLEDAGWIMRVRRRGRRKIHLLFDLAGNMHSPKTGHACTGNRTWAPRILDMHARETGQQDLKGREAKISPKGSPSATSPSEGGSPTTTPNQKTQTDPASQVDWMEAKATPDELAYWRTQLETHGPRSPLGKIARKVLDLPQNQERPTNQEASPARSQGPEASQFVDVEKPDPGTPVKVPQDPASRADMVWPG